MNYKSIDSSFFRNVGDKQPTLVLVHDFLTDKSCKNDIDRIRESSDPNEIRALKKRNLPLMTISVICSGGHKNKLKHTGLICIDIDAKENPHITDWVEFVHSLKWMPNVWFCGLSASGKGCFLIIGIKYPAKHLEHFRSIQQWFKNDMGIVIDNQCANENRLRFQSYNDESTSWFNHEANVWRFRVTNSKMPPPNEEVFPTEPTENAIKVEKCLRIITENEIDITEGNNWLKIGCALISEFGDAGRLYFHQVSKFHPSYTQLECDQKYSYWLNRRYRYTIRTFFYLCRQYGIVYDDYDENDVV